MSYKSGFVSIIGRPNAGKSTLLNALLKEKLAIISNKPQTTRNNIQGIITTDDYQIIFTDTPGIHKPQHALGRNMNKGAYTSLQDVDVIYLVVDAGESFGSGDEFLLDKLKNTNSSVFLVLNKIDKFSRKKVLALLNKWQKNFDFKEIIPISAMNEENLDELLKTTIPYLKSDFKYYPDDMDTDKPLSFRASELIREKIINITEEEVPHSIAVIIENIDQAGARLDIKAMIIVEKDSQKGIIIGKQGQMIKRIRLSSQKELKKLFNKKVELELYVRVEKNWRNKENKLAELGYKEDSNE